MPIPKNIERDHIFRALEFIDENGTPEEREATKFYVQYQGKAYSPKYVISMANVFANGEELPPSEFSGGRETNSFLTKRGFVIEGEEVKEKSIHSWTIHSWTIVSQSVAIKEMDKSTFIHNGTGIPKDIRNFFGVEGLSRGQRQKVRLEYKNKEYDAKIEFDKMENPRSRFLWTSSLSHEIRTDFYREYQAFKNGKENIIPLKMRFEKKGHQEFVITIPQSSSIDLTTIKEDIESEKAEEETYYSEGNVKTFYGKRYERNPVNRQRAIEVHGTSCIVCGFNFEEVYGEYGKDFIEVHHVKPLSMIGEEVEVNPQEDLVPLCANCHRMAHRNRDNVLSIEELKELINRSDRDGD